MGEACLIVLIVTKLNGKLHRHLDGPTLLVRLRFDTSSDR
jgi:hypothetical protein